MRKLFFANLATACLFALLGRPAFAEVTTGLVQHHGRYVCNVELQGKADVTIDQNGLLNAGRFGLYRIEREFAQVLMRGSLSLNECRTYPVRDFYLTPGSQGTIKVTHLGSTFIGRRQKLRLEIRASRNSVTLDNCQLVQ